jgi:hypothetical protein
MKTINELKIEFADDYFMNRSYDESIQMEDDDMNTINQSR